MQRRSALPLFAAVCLATLPGMGVAQQTGAPGTMTTVAGTGEAGDAPDGGPATQTVLNGPEGIAVDAAGNLFLADTGRVRKASPAGIISTVATRLTDPGFIAAAVHSTSACASPSSSDRCQCFTDSPFRSSFPQPLAVPGNIHTYAPGGMRDKAALRPAAPLISSTIETAPPRRERISPSNIGGS